MSDASSSSTLGRLRAALEDRYRVERLLGAGGMAVVFLAEDLRHRRRVAIKVLRPELAQALGAERFLREIETAAGLRHPHILPLYDSGEADGLLYYVMPYVEGESLRDRLSRERQLPVEEAVRIAREVADALSYAHSYGVVHRDVKPENVLLESNHAVVADFGIARAIDVAGETALTATGMAVGTPAYMSPEQAAGRGAMDARSDLYSLACVLYEMLAGSPPFTGVTVDALVHQHLAAEPPPVTQTRQTVPAGVDRAIRVALQKAPADRFATAREFADALDAGVRERAATASPRPRASGLRTTAVAAAVLAIAVGSYVVLGARDDAREAPERAVPRLVVLPFENLGPAEDEYFADGITDEVTARLAGLVGLAVIARQSAVLYKGSGKLPQEIGQELDADYLLEATISWQRRPDGRSRVRIRPQLIRARDATHVWADVYDEDLTEIFALQTRIATRVVEALDVALAAREERTLAATPTRNPQAHDAYLRGRHHTDRDIRVFSGRDIQVGIQLFGRALELDPEFAPAHAALGRAHRDLYWWAVDRSEERLALAKRSLDRALELDPDLFDARLGVAEYHFARFDYASAIRELEALRAERPNSSEIVYTIGAVRRREGRWDEAVGAMAQAVRLDPRSAFFAFNLGLTYWLVRDLAAAEREMRRGIALSVESPQNFLYLAQLMVTRDGNTAAARGVLADAEAAGHARSPFVVQLAVQLDLLDRRPDAARRRLREPAPPEVFEWQFWYVPAAAYVAETFAREGRLDSARVFYDAARRLAETRAREHPADPRYQNALGIAYAGLGRRDEAVTAARRAVDLMPLSRDAFRGIFHLEKLAEACAIVGDHECALDTLERLLTIPSHFSAAFVGLDPRWDAVRGHPRFERLVAR
jgi:eukaryotic-like serine/threonine-protein kinase